MVRTDWDLEYIQFKLKEGEDVNDCIDTLIYLLENEREINENTYEDLEDVVNDVSNDFLNSEDVENSLTKIMEGMIK